MILEFGQAAKIFMDETFQGLTLGHIEVDEIWTFVAKKQARLTLEERANSGQSGRLRPTAAMMAGVTDRLWRFNDLYDEVIQYG